MTGGSRMTLRIQDKEGYTIAKIAGVAGVKTHQVWPQDPYCREFLHFLKDTNGLIIGAVFANQNWRLERY